MSGTLRWGIIGTGAIANSFAAGLAEARTGRLVAVASREQATAERFGEQFGAERRFGNYADLLADGEIDAVYVATPHPFHAEWAIRAAEAGKHVVCEKPMGVNHSEAMAVVEAARRHDVFLVEGYMYRCHPQIARLVELIQNDAIGPVRLIEATFSFRLPPNPAHRLYRHDLAGGGILDVGGYPASIASLVAGAATGKPFVEPGTVTGAGHIGQESRVDEWAIASLAFPGGIVAQLATGIGVAGDNIVRVVGDEGRITLPMPWFLRGHDLTTTIIVERVQEREEIALTAPASAYALEADLVGDHLAAREAPPPAMGRDESLANMRTLDRWRDAIGLVYDQERPGAHRPPVHGRPLARRPDQPMRYGEVTGVGKPISRLVLGVDNQRTMPHAAVMFDEFFERGGTCFDTAWSYLGGLSERLLGQWVADRGVRDEVVLLSKCVHPPHTRPSAVASQLAESLDRLQTDYVDVYALHRDDPAVPVGEWIDALDEHLQAGRIRAYGASNWSLARVEEANAWAKANGRTGFALLSNNLSLARMVEPVWPGCVAASDPDSRAWLTDTQIPIFPWSSQARGFFARRPAPTDRSDPELARAWFADDNFARLDRATQFAAKRGVDANVVALAWVLQQPFPTFPLVGPRTLSETRTSFAALDLTLTPEEVAWLNLEQ